LPWSPFLTADARADITPFTLFAGFFSIGICGFGGVLPWARRMVVEQRGWLSGPEFTDLLALCQFLPGPNVINLSVAIGGRYCGLAGALAAFIGLMAAPMVIVVLLALVYAHYADVPAVQHLFQGLAAGASGLVVAMAVKIAAPLRENPLGIAIAVASFAAVALLRLPLLPTLLVLAPLSVLLRWRFGRKRAA